MILYFSGCGNSRFVASELANLLNETLLFIPDEMKLQKEYEFHEDEALGFVFPVYSWAPAKIVSDFIKGMRMKNKPAYVFAIATYGDNCGRTPEMTERLLSAKGLSLDAFHGFMMPETYINLPGFKLDTPEGEKAKIDKAREMIPDVCESIASRKRGIRNAIIGSMPGFKSYIVKPLFYASLITDRHFRVSDDCIGCGNCVKHCPVGNIEMKDGRPSWKGNCAGCMACYHHCPTCAIQHLNAKKGMGQYFFGH